ncbi:MAG: FAD-dependent oxidoreductase [Planctomycetes bacterium]|nr:FAD-dependent oxidoreductase [Planctomycetota bacterium]
MSANPNWRVAIIGSGPSAFYTAEALFKTQQNVHVDMFDRLPVPFGLVRGGVAPDHQKIKSVTRVYDKIATDPGFRFFGNVMLGRDVGVDDLTARYHQVVYAFGCESDNKLGAPGEDLEGVHSATEFVGWYNGHPDHRHRVFDLANSRRVALIGNGNVAMDVARVLLQSPDRIAPTDIADYAVAALRASTVEEVVLLGRRGPAQAAFSPKEIAEIDELDGVDVVVRPEEAELDALSATWLERDGARSQHRNVEFIRQAAAKGEGGSPRKLRCRFLVGPTEILGADGRVRSIRIQHMELKPDDDGTPRPRPKGTFEDLEADLVFKAIGYRGEPVPGVPFDERNGIVPNQDGRVTRTAGGAVVVGQYVAGWCKRGPTGLIGTNSADAKATVEAMLADRSAGSLLGPTAGDIGDRLGELGIDAVSWADWRRLDAWELDEGQKRGKLRHKLASVEEMMAIVRRLR